MALRIFISGTQGDMAAERDTAELVIRSAGHDPVRAETRGSVAVPPLHVCIDMAITCDLYVGIFGPRYGTVPNGLPVSVTELEFNMARGADPRKILVYRKVGNVEQKQAEFLARVENFTEGYFRRPRFQTAEELREFLREDISEWIADRIQRTSNPAERVQTVAPVPRVQRRAATEGDLRPILDAIETGFPPLRIEALKDLEALSYRMEVEKNEEVLVWLRRLFRGSVETRMQTMRTLRTFLLVTDDNHRASLRQQFHDAVLQQFASAQDVSVKQQAMDLLGYLVRIDDFDDILYHITSSPKELYCKPFYLVEMLKNEGHESRLREALYDQKHGVVDPEVNARIDELLEYLRWRH